MKQANISKYALRIVFILAAMLPLWVQAQDPGPDPDVPIDGGMSILLAAALSYGVKKMLQSKRTRSNGPVL